MTLTEIAQYKFNRDVHRSPTARCPQSRRRTDRPISTRLPRDERGHRPDADGMTLTEIAAVKFNNDTRPDDRQTVRTPPA